MPYVNIRLAGQLSIKQKEEICTAVTAAIARITGKPEESVLIFIDEVKPENIASGGQLLHKPA